MGSRKEAAIFRGFGVLTMLNLLKLQAELVDIDLQLRTTWREDDVNPAEPERFFSVDFYLLRKDGQNTPQLELLELSQQKLQAYRG